MTTRYSSRRTGCAAALLMSLLLCGCSDHRKSNVSDISDSAQAESRAAVEPATRSAPVVNAAAERDREQRIAHLGAELSAARAEQARLLQHKAETEARIAAHQEEGMELLSSLKAQSRTRQGEDAGFQAKAKDELESVLARDDSMNAELVMADEELARVGSKIESIDEELESLRARSGAEKLQ